MSKDNNFNDNFENKDFSNTEEFYFNDSTDSNDELEQENAFLKRKSQINRLRKMEVESDDVEESYEEIDTDEYSYSEDNENLNFDLEEINHNTEEDLEQNDNNNEFNNDIEFIFDNNESVEESSNNDNNEHIENESLFDRLLSENENSTEENIPYKENINDNNTNEIDDLDDDLMNDLLSNADEIINKKEYIDINLEEDDNDYKNEIQEIINESEDDEDIIDNNSEIEDESENEEEIDNIPKDENSSNEEEFDGYYSEEELNEKRNMKNKKGSFIKIIIGVIFLALITALAFGVRTYINKNNKPKINVDNQIILSPEPDDEPETDNEDYLDDEADEPDTTDEVNNPEDTTEETDVSDVDETEDTDSEDTNIEETNNKEDSEASLFMQNYTGHVLSIKDDSLVVAYNLTYDKVKILNDNFLNFIINNTKNVWVNESKKTYHLTNHDKNLVDMTLSQTLHKEFTLCEECKTNINIENYLDVIKNYDYLTDENLSKSQTSKFIYEDKNVLPKWISIGSEVNITYIQDPELSTNEIIEITKVEKGTDNSYNNKDKNQTSNNDNKENDNTDDTSINGNVWGNEFEKIVARINDRRKQEEGQPVEDISDTIELTLKENVSVDIKIGKASIVWFQIAWKSNSTTKDIPAVEDVAVELVTANGSLINDKNISKYGKKWIDKGVINFVIRDTQAGNWKVLFTKDTGTYLGDVMIQAVPITGFLQINKADAKYSDGKIHVIWEAKGVADDYCKVNIYARNGNKDVLIFAGNTIDDGIHTVDMVDIDASKIAGNTYDIVIRITDIDATASKPQQIKASYVTDEFIVKNVEVPKIQ